MQKKRLKKEMENSIGILAFGSLIDNPGCEIESIESMRIVCKTPFKVEFARISTTRNNAPTLIPVDDSATGKKVKATLIVLKDNISLNDAKSILYRRELHTSNSKKVYNEPIKPTSKNVLIGEINNFCSIEKVIYTSFLLQEEYKNLTAEMLADFAIESILNKAGKERKDGIRYLLSIKNFGIKTELSEEYEEWILKKTKTKNLLEAIENLDIERENINKNKSQFNKVHISERGRCG